MNTKIQACCEYLTWTFVVGCSQLYMNQLSQGNLNATTSLFLHRNKINKNNVTEINLSKK